MRWDRLRHCSRSSTTRHTRARSPLRRVVLPCVGGDVPTVPQGGSDVDHSAQPAAPHSAGGDFVGSTTLCVRRPTPLGAENYKHSASQLVCCTCRCTSLLPSLYPQTEAMESRFLRSEDLDLGLSVFSSRQTTVSTREAILGSSSVCTRKRGRRANTSDAIVHAVPAALPLPADDREGSSGLVGDACARQLDDKGGGSCPFTPLSPPTM